MKHIQKLIVTLTAGAIFTTALTGCSGEAERSSAANTPDTTTDAAGTGKELIELHIGYPSSGSDWPNGVLGVADEYGYLEEYLNPLGYTAKSSAFVGAAPAIHEALVAGDLDYVVYAGFAGVLGKSNGIDTQLLAVTSFSSQWRLIASVDSGIKSIEDLKGKKVAYTRGAAPHMYLIKTLEEGGLTFENIEAVNMTIPDSLSAVAGGAVDAAVVSGGQETSLVQEGRATILHIGFNADKDTYYEPMVLIGRTGAIEENKAAAVAITKAFFKAKDKIAEDTGAYYQLSADRSGNPLEIVLATAEEDLDIAFPLTLDQTYINSLKQIQEFLISNELAVNKVDFENWVNPSIIEQAIEEYNSEK